MDVLARHEWFSLSILPPWYFFPFYGRGTLANFQKKAQRGSEAERQKRAWATHTHASHDLDIKAKPDRDNTRAPKNEKTHSRESRMTSRPSFCCDLPLAPPPYPKGRKNWNTPRHIVFREGFFRIFRFSRFKKVGDCTLTPEKNSTADRMATVLCRGSSPLGVWPNTPYPF
jgi:hypothetical protein